YQPHRHPAKAQFAADAVNQVAVIAFGQIIDAGSEYHKGWRSGLGLRDVTQLDPPSARCWWRVFFNRILEPAVELAGGNALRPYPPRIERCAHQLVYPLAGKGGNRDQGHIAHLSQPVVQSGTNTVEQLAWPIRHIPLVNRDNQAAAFLNDLVGNSQVLSF